MKIFTICIILAVGSCIAVAQSPISDLKDRRAAAPVMGKEGMHLEMIRLALRSDAPFNEAAKVQLHRMGDEAAVNLIKVLGIRGEFNEASRATAFEIIRASFEEPTSILIANDQQPYATLFLLNYLNALAKDAATKVQISEIRDGISKSLKEAGMPMPQ